MSSREEILGRLRKGLGRGGPLTGAAAAELEARLKSPRPNLIPARAQIPHADQVKLFEDMALFHVASVAHVADLAGVPRAVADYLKAQNIEPRIKMSPDASLDEIPWDSAPMLEISRGIAEEPDPVGVTPAFAGIAETGTLFLTSGPGTPATLNFLPETHVVVLKAADVVGTYEDAWGLLRERMGQDVMPRAVNMITGPSRTADINQQLVMGAHGPKRLHIIIVDGGKD